MIIDPSKVPWLDAYRLMTATILPRPIAWVSTVSGDGIRNLAPFSFFTAVAANPLTICFSPMRRGADGSKKDTLRNIEETGEFVVNVVSEPLTAQMNQTSADVSPSVDEFELGGLTPVPSQAVRPPRVGESLVSYECKLLQVVPVGGDVPGAGAVVLGTVLRLHIADAIMQGGRVSLEALRPVGRMAAQDYVRCTDLFTLPRP